MSTSNRRQPARSARTSTTRPINYYARPHGFPGAATSAVDHEIEDDTEPGFFPAITHFTDGVAALPKEVMRHFTLLRETEGKAYAPDQAIADIVGAMKKLPPPPKHLLASHMQAYVGFSLNNSVIGSANASMIDGHFPQSRPATADPLALQLPPDPHAELRRSSYQALRQRLREVIGVLDEKNMVLTTVNETLAKQLGRMEETLPHVELEVSEEARLGSNTHWALPHMKEHRKITGVSNERSRREIQAANNLAAAAAVVGEHDLPPTRSETRREALQAKRKVQTVDSDFDDRPGSRKAQASTKIRKVADAPVAADMKVSTTNPAPPLQPNKRRKIEKGSALAGERSVSGNVNGKANHMKDIGTSQDHGAEISRKKPKPMSMVAATRKRNAANSPSRLSSPSRGTFATSTAAASSAGSFAVPKEQSPAPSIQRVNARMRQNSTQSIKSSGIRNAASGMTNGKVHAPPKASTPDLKTTAELTGRTVSEARAGLTDAYKSTSGYQTIEEDGMVGALVMTSNTPAMANKSQSDHPGRIHSELKREETEPAEGEDAFSAPRQQRVEPISADSMAQPQSVPMAMTRSRNGITKSTKPVTPINSALPEAPTLSRSRSTRGINPLHNSATVPGSSPHLGAVGSPRKLHKRGANHSHSLASPARSSASSDALSAAASGMGAGASAAAGMAAAIARSTRVAQGVTTKSSRRSPHSRSPSLGVHSDADADGEDDNGPDGPSSPASDEPRYCVCGQVSYGDMIACDNDMCPHEWFHLQCVGLTKAPGGKAKWYCDECKELLRSRGRMV